LSEEELNALIAHAHRRIDQLQRQLAEQLASEQLRIDAALEKQQEADEKLLEDRIKQEREKLERDFLLTKDQWVSYRDIVVSRKYFDHKNYAGTMCDASCIIFLIYFWHSRPMDCCTLNCG